MSVNLIVLCLAITSQPGGREGVDFFETRVRPVLVDSCYHCHSERAKALKGGLRLDSRAAMLAGGDSGPAVVPGRPDESRLVKAIRYEGQAKEMPPDGKLSFAEIEAVARWVEIGAPWPEESGGKPASGEGALEGGGEGAVDWERRRRGHWAFRPLGRPLPPEVEDAAWSRSPIDRFILARLEAAGLRPAREADRRTLVRRLWADLIGLPPTPEDVDAFVRDDRPDAYERLVDELLASPQYAERWARHWLDVARYSDGMGAFVDGKALPHAYQYRDWVVRAFNRDLPYDDFVRFQIAGDLLQGKERAGRVIEDAVAGPGFFALGPEYTSDGGDPDSVAQARSETLDDRVDTLSRGFLALTVACARCHDHKFDPIPTLDYYSIAGVFNNTKSIERPIVPKAAVDRYERAQASIKKQQARIAEWIAAEERRVERENMRRAGEYLLASRRLDERRAADPGTSVEDVAREAGLIGFVLQRWVKFLGDPESRKRLPALGEWFSARAGSDLDAVAARFQAHVRSVLDAGDGKAEQRAREELRAVLAPLSQVKKRVESVIAGDRRRELAALRAELDRRKREAPPKPPVAHSLVDSGNADMRVALRGNLRKPGPVAPRRFLRVLAGADPPRFTSGSGRLELAEAVASAGNPLTARVFVNRVWMHHFGRALVRTPSNFGALGEKPTHPRLLDWLARSFIDGGWSIKRLHRAIVLSSAYRMSSHRDEGAFATDGDNRLIWRMNPRRLDVEAWRDSLLAVCGEIDLTLGGEPTRKLLESRRRTLYSAISRNGDKLASDEFLRLFDFPAARVTSAGRTTSTVPQQYLFMLNNEFMVARARAFARRLAREITGENQNERRIERAYRLLYGRPPAEAERRAGVLFLASAPASGEGGVKLSPWEQYAQVLLDTNEFLYIR